MTKHNVNGQRWVVQYRHRMVQGLEHCRAPEGCSVTTGLTFDHIHPKAHGGTLRFNNTTILCVPHQMAKADSTELPWSTLPSLEAEELAAPPEQRWSQQVVPAEVADRLRGPRRRQARATRARLAGEPWRNETWTAQLATLNLEDPDG